MTRRSELLRRIGALEDIGQIMRSMQNLAYLEARKLGRFLASQHGVVAGIEGAAVHLLHHHPRLTPSESAGDAPLYLVIGAERGFCGGFDEPVRAALEKRPNAAEAGLVVVGARLAVLLEGDARLLSVLPGASAAEEVPAVLAALVELLNPLLGGQERPLVALYRDEASGRVEAKSVLPPFPAAGAATGPQTAARPVLYLAPRRLMALLAEHYLFAVLHAILYSSLAAENRQRVRHLEGARTRLSERIADLQLRANVLRQEEITEEIELILLNAGQAAATSPGPG
jgi:F-type H+-transporting ATPase subunit gamma